jgi:nicotinamidase-related amidase
MAKNRALVVVDMQKDFVTGALANKEAQKIVPDIARYVRNWKGDLYFTRDTHYEKNYMSSLEGQKLPVPHCLYKSDGWNIVPEIHVPAKAKVINKLTFGSKTLINTLTAKKYDEIVFVGVCTDICVVSNVLLAKASMPETPIKVVERMCAGITPKSHKAALDTMRSCQIDIV